MQRRDRAVSGVELIMGLLCFAIILAFAVIATAAVLAIRATILSVRTSAEIVTNVLTEKTRAKKTDGYTRKNFFIIAP
jgi:hypothetical protein